MQTYDFVNWITLEELQVLCDFRFYESYDDKSDRAYEEYCDDCD